MFENSNLRNLTTAIFAENPEMSLNTGAVTDMSYMFSGTTMPETKDNLNFKFMKIDVATVLEGMFKNSLASTLDLTS